MHNRKPFTCPDLLSAVGFAVLRSLTPAGLQVVGRLAEGTTPGYVVHGEALPPCLVVGVADAGRWMPSKAAREAGEGPDTWC